MKVGIQKTIKLIITAFALICSLFFLLVGVKNWKSEKTIASAATIVDEYIQEIYYIGDTVTIADYYVAEYDGKYYQAQNIILKFPDGAARNSGMHSLAQIGKHTVIGFINIDGKIYEAEKDFFVLANSAMQKDEKAPLIQIENGVDSLNVAVGLKANLPSSYVEDGDVNEHVKTEMFYAYGESFESKVAIDAGSFTPNRAGTYTLVYSVSDIFGNVGYAYVNFNAVEVSGDPIEILIDKPDILTAGIETQIGWTVKNHLLNPVEISLNIASTNYNYLLTEEHQSFVPQESGEHIMRLFVSDGVYSYEREYSLPCEATGVKVIEADVELPRYFLKNSNNDLGLIKGFEYTSSGKQEIPVKTLARFDDGAWEEVDSKNFYVGNYKKVQLKLACVNDTSVEKELGEANIVDCGVQDAITMNRYFVGDVACVAKRSSMDIFTTVEHGNAHAEFVNTINFSSFVFDFEIPQDSSSFETLQFTFFDRYDLTKSFQCDVTNTDGVLYFEIDGYKALSMGSMRDGDASARFKIEYDSNEGKIFLYRANKKVNWMYFEVPLSNMLCTFDMNFINVYGKAGINLRQLNNQPFTESNIDEFGAQIYAKKIQGTFPVGEKISIDTAVAADVLSTVLQEKVVVSVQAPDLSIVKSTDEIFINKAQANRSYEFELSQKGVYTITYEATDENGNRSKFAFYIYANGYEKPTIVFNDGWGENTKVEAKVGATHEIKKFTASTTADVKLTTTVLVIRDNAIVSQNAESFVLTQKGTYTVYVYVSDENGNSALNFYKVVAQ